jgi:hypothetical protein
MLDTLTSDNYRDFSARYTHTFGWLITGYAKRLVHILRVGDDRVYFTDSTGMEYHAKSDAGINFEFIPVDHGYFNGKDGNTYLLNRIPARQWKRGIASSNTEIINFGNWRATSVNYANLALIFNDEFKTFNYPKEFQFGALSKHFAIHPKNKQVWMYDRHIGQFNDKVITLYSDLVQQELTDLMNRNGWDIKVEVAKD